MDIFSGNPRLNEAVNFFVYDTIKIFLLLAVIIFIVSIIRSFLPPERTRKILSHNNRFTGHVLAAVLGIFTPFCTCSAIPLFLGFVEAGVPLGVTFTFLVASPMINEVALIMLLGMFGWKVALLYIASGMTIAIAAGMAIGAMKLEGLLEKLELKEKSNPLTKGIELTWPDRIRYAKAYVVFIIKGVWPYVVIGIGAGAWIHGYVPVDFLSKYAGTGKWYAVPLAVAIGIPLYSNAAGIIPLVSALTEKGMAMGTTLAFMMAVTGLSFPEFMILRKVMKTRLILVFAGVVGAGIMLTGYLFNFVIK
ncbi:MAG: permease [Candidatus Omnitrophica bacterium]|nr:permease [Candidatus Omnitrophota bacterium]